MFQLPITLNVNGVMYPIRERGDYRAVINTMTALNDPDLEGNESFIIAIESFFIDYKSLPVEDYPEAIRQMNWFIDCGNDYGKKKQSKQLKLYDWEQDEQLICGAITKILQQPVRSIEYLHWWEFMSLFGEIGEGQFSTVVGIRQKVQTGKKLEKWEKDFQLRNKAIVELKQKLSIAEQRMIDAFDAD